jgi:hypothetical protein
MNIAKGLKMGFTVAVVSVCVVSVAFAGDQTRTRDRKKDGSCQNFIMEKKAQFDLAADQTRTKDRKRDGSCQNFIMEEKAQFDLAAGQARSRDRKRDGSCQG